jgi:hypothetical protein
MKRLILFILLIWNTILYSQNWNLSVKTGAANSLAAPVFTKQGFAYKTVGHSWVLPSLGLEFNRTRKNKNNILIGAALFPITGSFGYNSKNIDLTQSIMPGLNIYDYNVQLYAGIEHKLLRKDAPLYKNYFSINGGIGLNYFYHNSGKNGIVAPSYGKTKNGENLIGMDAGISRNVFGAPSGFGGLRYNITNSKGKNVAVIELMLNYGIVKYFDWRVIYEVNGIEKVDYIPEHGFNVQINIIIPIFNFDKRKKNE